MKTFFKLSLLILSITLVNCKKTSDYYEVKLENEPAIVRVITDLPDYFEDIDELFYLELVNPHPKLTYTALYVAGMPDGYSNFDEFWGPYKTEGLTVIISGSILVIESAYGEVPINDIYFHNTVITSIESAELK